MRWLTADCDFFAWLDGSCRADGDLEGLGHEAGVYAEKGLDARLEMSRGDRGWRDTLWLA